MGSIIVEHGVIVNTQNISCIKVMKKKINNLNMDFADEEKVEEFYQEKGRFYLIMVLNNGNQHNYFNKDFQTEEYTTNIAQMIME